MQIEDRGIICDVTKRPESQRAASFVSLCTTGSPSIFCAFQIGPTKNAANSTIRLYRSKDQGRRWQELGARFETKINGVPGSLAAGELVEVEPGRLLLVSTWFDRSDSTRPLFDPVTKGVLRTKQIAAFSADDGESWSPWRELDVGGLKGCSSTGPILKWSDGRIAYPFESYKEFDDPGPGTHGARLLVSADQGRTFGRPFLVAQHPEHKVYYWDQRMCVGQRPGEFISLFWTHDLENQKDLNVHIRKASLSDSSFQGTPISPTSIPGQIAAPLLLEDGRLLAFVVNRGEPGTMTLWSSRDGGASWPEHLVVYVHEERAPLTQGKDNINYEQYWSDMLKWSFGHPAIRPLGDGKILLAYYAGPPNCMSIHWVRVNVSAGP